jgi:hypothetical protein
MPTLYAYADNLCFCRQDTLMQTTYAYVDNICLCTQHMLMQTTYAFTQTTVFVHKQTGLWYSASLSVRLWDGSSVAQWTHYLSGKITDSYNWRKLCNLHCAWGLGKGGGEAKSILLEMGYLAWRNLEGGNNGGRGGGVFMNVYEWNIIKVQFCIPKRRLESSRESSHTTVPLRGKTAVIRGSWKRGGGRYSAKNQYRKFEKIFPEKELRCHIPNFPMCLWAIYKMWTDPENIYTALRHMNVEIGAEASQFPERNT